MDEIIQQYKKSGTLHHFYIIAGQSESAIEKVLNFCQASLVPKGKFASSVFQYQFDRLVIADARAICARGLIKAETGSKTIFVISFNSVTAEAQNSLLKSIEEPTANTIFFFIVPDSKIFLPTVLSRAILVKEEAAEETAGSRQLLDELLRKDIAGRMKFVESAIKDIKNEKQSRAYAREIVLSLMTGLRHSLSEKPEYAVSLRKLQEVNKYLADPAASLKILLERAILSLPK
ncbi:MAG TPA: hypothetical protein P5328_01980 [Candidatus Paceibacterota bacterium]|nr:hypothetical protein [Candidatus Paceibacterota bacterium]HRZ34478.1 hypothetical protein [Candidatus Paceibacterota bacterium]